MSPTYPKRLIEVDLPIKRISAHARREKAIRHGHISTLHIWWARRPLAACRAVICAALWPDPADELCPAAFREAAKKAMGDWAREHLKLASAESYSRFVAIQKTPAKLEDGVELRRALLDFIADFANWDNSTVREYLETSRALTQAAHEALGGVPGTRPLVVDPFAGGGSIPLEALRVGADAFASDLNPVAVLLNKVVLEYIPKYGQRLADEVRKWGAWIKEEAKKELAEFYPKDPDGATPIAYLWARTIRCEGPACGAQLPLLTNLWLSKKAHRNIALRMRVDERSKQIGFDITERPSFRDSDKGIVKRGSVTCLICGFTTPAERVRSQFKGRAGGASDARMIAVVLLKNGSEGRSYRLPTTQDLVAVSNARERLLAQQESKRSSLPLIPNEPLPYLRSIFNINLLDVTEWGQLFAPRQALGLVTLANLIRAVGDRLLDAREPLREAILACLGLSLDKAADLQNTLCRWKPDAECPVNLFARQAMPILWDFAEAVPISESSGSWFSMYERTAYAIERTFFRTESVSTTNLCSATMHPLPDGSAELLVTDPPYYDLVPYADLSDFFYVWLRRSVGEIFPDILRESLTPKRMEAVQLAERNPAYAFKTKEYYEQTMTGAMVQAQRVVKPCGIGIVFFAHKGTGAWESQLQSVINAGWTIMGSWPIDTECESRMRARNSAVLASSVQLVCRPRANFDSSVSTNELGDWRDVLSELPGRIRVWMTRLAEEGVVGADAIFACLGPALEIFSRYSRVEKASGEVVTLKEYLEQVWAAVAKEALSLVFKGADTAGFEPDARLTAMWLWTLNAGGGGDAASADEADSDTGDDEESASKSKPKGGFTLEYDAARKIAQGLGAHLEELSHLLEIKGDQARLLPVAERTKHLFGREEAQAPMRGRGKKKPVQGDLFADLKEAEEEAGWGVTGAPKSGETVLDRIHQSMILFAAGRGEALKRFLVEEGAGRDQRFWSLAQALSALYPNNTDEKRWVDGVLARKKSLGF